MKNHNNTTPHQAADYDGQIVNIIPGYACFHQEIINIVKAMKLKPNTWLDTGCGTGNLVKKAITEFPNTNFILCDPSAEMLRQAQKKLRDHTSGRLLFLKPIPTQDFPPGLCARPDIVTAILSHHYLSPDERKKATMACYNLLKEDGIYITFENIRPNTVEGLEIGMEYWKNFQLEQGRDFETVKSHLERFDREFFPITLEEHLNLLRETGFEVVEILWYSYMQAGFFAKK
ncbi:MAG TPA: class I SAM-dependent methyltransferase [Methanobacteriaceae archaeon]|nr:class I SAM-dependent methyltransferase [Methanobacteriaceae archaeon]